MSALALAAGVVTRVSVLGMFLPFGIIFAFFDPLYLVYSAAVVVYLAFWVKWRTPPTDWQINEIGCLLSAAALAVRAILVFIAFSSWWAGPVAAVLVPLAVAAMVDLAVARAGRRGLDDPELSAA